MSRFLSEDHSFFLSLFSNAEQKPFIDVRSQSEYNNGHIPTAIHIPLFSDEERAIVGTTYKQGGRHSAIEKGLSLISLSSLVEKIKECKLPKELILYCARGGMRSQAMGWLFELLGYKVTLIPGGYKTFRRFVLSLFAKTYSLCVLSGKTGVGKTDLLQKLKKKHEPMLDLEELAQHRGSVFGALAHSQPSQEQFENLLGLALFDLQDKTFWVEDESRFIGTMRIPDSFFNQMQKAPVYLLSSTPEERVQRILRDYAAQPVENLTKSICQLKKGLGEENTKKAVALVEEKNYAEAILLLMHYYDERYERALSKRDPNTIHREEILL